MKKQTDPRMHTAEHILNQTMVRMFDRGRCFSAHIEKKKSKCDYHFHRAVTEEEIREVEKRVNEVIRADAPVREKHVAIDEARRQYSLERLPENVMDAVRIIHVGDYDACPCIGRHVDATGEIGAFRITTWSFENGVLRIRFKLAKPDKVDH